MRGFPSALNVRVLEFISGKLTLGGGFKYVSLFSLGKNDPIWPLRIFFNWVEITNIRTWLAHPALPIGNVLNRLIPRQAMFLDWSVYMVICSDTYVGNALYPRKSPKSRAVSDCIICRAPSVPSWWNRGRNYTTEDGLSRKPARKFERWWNGLESVRLTGLKIPLGMLPGRSAKDPRHDVASHHALAGEGGKEWKECCTLDIATYRRPCGILLPIRRSLKSRSQWSLASAPVPPVLLKWWIRQL